MVEKLNKELEEVKARDPALAEQIKNLEKALKSKLAELESKGILRVENKASKDGPIIHLNIPDPEVSFDESYVNDLLQRSLHISESRPLSNLQDCLNSLKKKKWFNSKGKLSTALKQINNTFDLCYR
ncbi:golgin subfamily A member 3 [Trichonephila clavipes]|nr:golgin subfamily A member 3 [Trichonephila clavipes]